MRKIFTQKHCKNYLPVKVLVEKSIVASLSSAEEVLRLNKLVALLQFVSLSDETIGA